MSELCAYGSGTWLHKEKLFFYVLMGPAHGHTKRSYSAFSVCGILHFASTLALSSGSGDKVTNSLKCIYANAVETPFDR